MKQLLQLKKLRKNYKVTSISQNSDPERNVIRTEVGDIIEADTLGLFCQPGFRDRIEIWVDGRHINPEERRRQMGLCKLIRTNDYQTKSRLTSLAIVKEDETDYCGFYWGHLKHRLYDVCGSHDWQVVKHTYWRLARIYKRHRQLCHYVREVRPQWRDVGEIHYADNSVEMKQIDKDGNERQVMTVPPSGDRCF